MKPSTKYKSLLKEIKLLVAQARDNIARNINIELLFTYWTVGRLIVDKENSERYDENSVRQMLVELSKELTGDLGKGFSRSQLTYMRLFFLRFPNFHVPGKVKFGVTLSHQTQKISKSKAGVTLSHQKLKLSKKQVGLAVSHQLSWSHYYELLKCNSDPESSFYQQTSITENWSVRELRRQIDSALFERIALSKNKKAVRKLAAKGHVIKSGADFIKDPYTLEFLNIPQHYSYTEKQLEQRIIDNLQKFILEMGKGFAFVARQNKITLNNKHYHVDLVFYHRVLKCFVLIDLKVRNVEHTDIGQMNLYLNYFEAEQNEKNDNPPIGIILGKHKDDVTVEYAMRGMTNKIFVSKYQLYLPDKKLLQKKVKELLGNNQPTIKK